MLKILSLAALLLTILPCLCFMAGLLTLDAAKVAALVGTIVWFATAPLWIGHQLEPAAH